MKTRRVGTRTERLAQALLAFLLATGSSLSFAGEDKDKSPGEPFQITLCEGLAASPGDICFGSSSTSSFTVSTTKRLVIEYVSGECRSEGDPPIPTLETEATSSAVVHHFDLGTNLFGTLWLVAQQTRLYADPSSEVTLEGGPLGGCNLSLSGLLLAP